MAYDASGNENSFFFLSEHVKDRGCGYDSAFSGSCGYDFAFCFTEAKSNLAQP